jgi:hypothetical protein
MSKPFEFEALEAAILALMRGDSIAVGEASSAVPAGG